MADASPDIITTIWIPLISGVGGAVLGALISGFASVKVAQYQYNKQLEITRAERFLREYDSSGLELVFNYLAELNSFGHNHILGNPTPLSPPPFAALAKSGIIFPRPKTGLPSLMSIVTQLYYSTVEDNKFSNKGSEVISSNFMTATEKMKVFLSKTNFEGGASMDVINIACIESGFGNLEKLKGFVELNLKDTDKSDNIPNQNNNSYTSVSTEVIGCVQYLRYNLPQIAKECDYDLGAIRESKGIAEVARRIESLGPSVTRIYVEQAKTEAFQAHLEFVQTLKETRERILSIESRLLK